MNSPKLAKTNEAAQARTPVRTQVIGAISTPLNAPIV